MAEEVVRSFGVSRVNLRECLVETRLFGVGKLGSGINALEHILASRQRA